MLAGLRYEKSQLDLATPNRRDENDTADFPPSLHLSYPLGERHEADRQLQRAPAGARARSDLNPVPFMLDPINYRTGNPNPKPQETQAFELGWQYRKRPDAGHGHLYYRQNDKVVSDVVTDIGGGVFVTTKANVAQSRNGGLELVLNGKLSKTLTYTLSSNLFWTELDGSNLGFQGDRSAFTVSGTRQPQLAGHGQGPDPDQRASQPPSA